MWNSVYAVECLSHVAFLPLEILRRPSKVFSVRVSGGNLRKQISRSALLLSDKLMVLYSYQCECKSGCNSQLGQHFEGVNYSMDQGVANHSESGLLTTDDLSNTSATSIVVDYSSVPPVTEPPIPTSAAKIVDTAAELEKSDDWGYQQNGELKLTHGGGDYSMEAPILAEDVIRAGGLGARDELGHFLPSAMDATDFEASLRDAQQYEDAGPESDLPRPGVGFVKDQQKQMDGVREV